MEKKWIPVVVVALLLGVAFGCAKREKVIATVGDEVITEADFNERIAKLPPGYQRIAQARKREFLDEMVLEILLAKEGKRRNLQNDKEVQELLNQTERKIIIAKLIDDEAKKVKKVGEEELRSYYESHKNDFALPERYKASHIMVETQKEAEDVLAKLKGGAPFEELAKTVSKDPSKEQGGDINYFTKGQLLPEFEEAATALNIGELSGVVKTTIGYHVIKLTDKQDARIASFEEVRQRIETELLDQKRRQAIEDLVKKLKDKTKIKVEEKLLEKPKPEEPASEEKNK